MTTTEIQTQPDATAPEAEKIAEHKTWRQFGSPQEFTFYGTARKGAEGDGVKVASVVKTDDGLKLKGANGRAIKDGTFAASNKFWATDVVPAPKAERAPRPEQTIDPAKVTEMHAAAELVAGELDDVLIAARQSSDPLERIVALTELIGAARNLVSAASEARIAAVREASDAGLKLTTISKASGLSAARLQQVKSGRRAYVPVAERN